MLEKVDKKRIKPQKKNCVKQHCHQVRDKFAIGC